MGIVSPTRKDMGRIIGENMKTWQRLREEQEQINPSLQKNPMYRFMMLENQIGHLCRAISYMECAKIDHERYGHPDDYKGELKKSLSDSFAMLFQLCLHFGLGITEIMELANLNLEEFNKTRIPREIKEVRVKLLE